MWVKNHLHIKESGDPLHASQFRELLPATAADGDLDLKSLAANQRELGQNLCWALKLRLVISFSPLAHNQVSQLQPGHVLPVMTFWLHTAVLHVQS